MPEREGARVPWIISYRKTHFLSLDLPAHLQGISLLFKCSAGMTHPVLQTFNDADAGPHRRYITGHLWPADQLPALFFKKTLRFSAFESLLYTFYPMGQALAVSLYWYKTELLYMGEEKHLFPLTLILKLAVDFK